MNVRSHDRPGDDAKFSGSEDELHEDEREQTVADVLRWLWSQRVIFVIGIALSLIGAALFLSYTKVDNYENQVEYVIQFRFDGRDEGRYPNGTPFSLGDIIAPAILAEVYREDGLSNFGLSFAAFQSSINISPYAPDRRLIIDRYSQFDSRRATVAEISEAQSALQRELSTATARYATLRYTGKVDGLPPSKAGEVLVRIAKAWERVAIETRGVLEIDIETVSPEVFADQSVEGLERLSAMKLIRENIGKLRDFVDKIAARPGGNRLRDEESGVTVASLRAKIGSSYTRLAEIPVNWLAASDGSNIDTLGLPIGLYSASLFAESDIKSLDYLVALDLLSNRAKLVMENTDRILARRFGEVTQDPTTGLTAGDVQRLLDDLNEFTIKQLTAPVLSLGVSRNPEGVRLYYVSRLQELEREKALLSSKARALENANKDYQGLVSTAPADGQSPPTNTTVIPQFGEGFLDRLISLTQEGNDSEFRQKLLQDAIGFQQKAADIDSEIARARDYLARFGQAAGGIGGESQKAELVKTLNVELPATLAKLKQFSEVTQRIAHRLRFAEDVYFITTGYFDTSRSIDFYLRGSATSDITIPDLLKDLRDSTVIAGRLYRQVSASALGTYQTLFDAASAPELARQPLITRYDLLVFALAAVLGVVFGLVTAIAIQVVRGGRLQRAE